MSFWVYENKIRNRARIHTSECRYCNDGKGVGGASDNVEADEWHGPFKSFASAEKKANSLGRKDVAACGACKPDVKKAAATKAAAPAKKATPAKKAAPAKAAASAAKPAATTKSAPAQ